MCNSVCVIHQLPHNNLCDVTNMLLLHASTADALALGIKIVRFGVNENLTTPKCKI